MLTKEDFFNYIGAGDSIYGYSRSYKLVLFKILFSNLWENKKSYVFDVARQFKNFYINRINDGKIPDKDVDERIEKANFSTVNDILDVIKLNPYRFISEKGFLEIQKDEIGDFFVFPKEIVDALTKADIFRLLDIIYKKINLYFSKIDGQAKPISSKFSLPQLGEQEAKCGEIIDGILEKFSKLDADSLIDKILDSKEEYESICETVKAILKWKKIDYITVFHKELITLFLVGTAKFYYNDGEGGFWNQVEKIIPQINGNNHSDIVDAFYKVIKQYNLPSFEEERSEGYKLIAPIICHAGIPVNCLDSFFDAVYQVRGVKYSYIENELDFACRYADKPVKRYVKFLSGRGILADEVQNLQELIVCVLSNKEISNNLDFSFETKMAAVEWAQNKSKTGTAFSGYLAPELIFDSETYGLSVHLPKIKLKDERWILWEIKVGEKVVKKKVYGKEIENGYIYSDCEILINPNKTISAQLYSYNGRLLDEFLLKSEKDYLVFNNNGKQNKGKYISKKPSYFICDDNVTVCDNLQVVFEYENYAVYVNDPKQVKEIWINNGIDTITYIVKEKPELSGGRLAFEGKADFDNVDVYCTMPEISVPFDGDWEITVIHNDNERFDCVKNASEYISIDNVIKENIGTPKFGVYKVRIKHIKSGFSSFKFVYFPSCSVEKTGFFPSDEGYDVSKLRFVCSSGAFICDENDVIISTVEIPISETVFSGNVCFENLKIPFSVNLKAFTWEIFNEEKAFCLDNRKAYISSNDIKESTYVMINVSNHTDKVYSLEIYCGENFSTIYYIGARRTFSFNLKEISENIDASKESFATISILVASEKKFSICAIRKHIHIRNFSGRATEGNEITFWWEENGSLSDRELVVSDLIFPYKRDMYAIEDGEKSITIRKGLFDKAKSYMVYVQQKEKEYSGIYDIMADKKRILTETKLFIGRKNLSVFNEVGLEEIIAIEKPTFEQIIYAYLFILLNDYGNEFKESRRMLLNIYRELIIEYRIRLGDAEFYKNIFEYEIDGILWDKILKDLALIMPCFLSDPKLDNQTEETLKKMNLVAYVQYIFTTKQLDKFLAIKGQIESLKDEESFILAKADLIFPGYQKDKEVFRSVQEWKRVQINHQWLKDYEALCYTLIDDIILDDINKRLKRVNFQYSNAIWCLSKNYKKSFLQIFIMRIEKSKRR